MRDLWKEISRMQFILFPGAPNHPNGCLLSSLECSTFFLKSRTKLFTWKKVRDCFINLVEFNLLLFLLLIGHEYYVDAVKKKKLFKLHPRDVPWSTRTISEQEFAKIIGIEFETKLSTILICLKVNLID